MTTVAATGGSISRPRRVRLWITLSFRLLLQRLCRLRHHRVVLPQRCSLQYWCRCLDRSRRSTADTAAEAGGTSFLTLPLQSSVRGRITKRHTLGTTWARILDRVAKTLCSDVEPPWLLDRPEVSWASARLPTHPPQGRAVAHETVAVHSRPERASPHCVPPHPRPLFLTSCAAVVGRHRSLPQHCTDM